MALTKEELEREVAALRDEHRRLKEEVDFDPRELEAVARTLREEIAAMRVILNARSR